MRADNPEATSGREMGPRSKINYMSVFARGHMALNAGTHQFALYLGPPPPVFQDPESDHFLDMDTELIIYCFK